MLLDSNQQQQQQQQQQQNHQQQQLQQMALQTVSSELDPAYAQFRDQTRFWIQRVAVPMLMVIGLFGNSITVIIMTRRRMRSTTNMYLAALAFVDMLYLVLTFLLGLSHYPNMAGQKYYAYWKLRPFLMMLTDACSNTSVWLTVTFTIERYIAVKYPMKGKVWCTEKRAKMLIVCVFVFGILFASPVPFEWKVIEKRTPQPPKLYNLTQSYNVTLSPPTRNEHELHHQQATNSSRSSSSIDDDHTNDLANKSSDEDGDGDEDSDPVGYIGTSNIQSSQVVGNVSSIDTNSDSSRGFSASSLYSSKNDTNLAKAAVAAGKVGNTESDSSSFILALDYSDFGKNETYKTIYYWSTAVIFYFIPLFSLMLFNGFLIKSVHQSKRERTKMTRPSTTSSTTQSSLPKADINVTVNGNVSDQLSLMKPQKGSGKKFKLLQTSSSSGHKGNRNSYSKDSSIIEESSQSSPLLERGYSMVKKNEQVGLETPQSPAVVTAVAMAASPATAAAAADVTSSATNKLATEANETRAIPLIDDTSDLTMEIKGLSELNVQINCDNESITTKRTEGNRMHNSNEQSQTNSNNSVVDPKETIKTIGVPQTRHSPLRRSQLTNSSSRSQHSMVPASTQERRITIMLIAVVILFLVCQIPSAAMLLYTSVNELVPNTNEHALVLAFGNIFNFLMAVNAAGNFILYSFLSKKYRRTFMILFCSCLKSKQKYTEPRRLHSVRFEPSKGQSQRNSTIYQNNKTSDKVHRDTLV